MEAENRLLGDRYLMKKQLGKGGSGSVYLCHDNKLQKDWAVKELAEPTDIERSMELELLKTISCNVFPRIVDIVKDGKRIFLVMDYIEGITLKDRMKRQILTEADVLTWAVEIAKGIRYLHQMTPPILYMDCKPDNIMLTKEGEIRLIDLGSAYVCRTDKKQRISGTYFFAPKEQRNRKNEDALPDVRSDIYAFGMTLYYLLAGGRRESRRNGKLCIKDMNPSVSWGMSHIIEKCTMENPRQRYQSMEEVLEQLRHIRKIGKWKAGKVRTFRMLALLGKAACAFGVLLTAYGYRQAQDIRYLFLALLSAGLWLISCMGKRITMYEVNRDIFCGSGKRILYFVLLVTGLLIRLQVPSYAAWDGRASDLSIKAEAAPKTAMKAESRLKVTVYDSQSRKILIQDGAEWGIEEDIMLVIPMEEIEEGNGKITISYMDEEMSRRKEYSFGCYRE